MNHESELDCAIGMDPSRTFPAPRRRDYSTLRLIAAIVLVAIGCALLITAGNPSTVGL